jgi:hypothetical protein
VIHGTGTAVDRMPGTNLNVLGKFLAGRVDSLRLLRHVAIHGLLRRKKGILFFGKEEGTCD